MPQKIYILDSSGNPINHPPLSPATREQLSLTAYNHLINSPDAEQFVYGLALEVADQSTITKGGNLNIDSADPRFQDYCLNAASQKIINDALDENLSSAYSLLANLTGASQYQNNQNEMLNLSDDDLAEISNRLSFSPELQLAHRVCDIQNEISSTLDGRTQKTLTTYQVNRLQENFEDIVPYLNFEQRATGYYNTSLLHRVLLREKDFYNPQENNAEKTCLKKVLEYTADYKRINYCLNRLEKSSITAGLSRAAYRRALTESSSPQDLYKINIALAESYIEGQQGTMGFYTFSSAMDQDQSIRAELYYQQAFKFAQQPEKIGILKNIAKLQFRRRDIKEWTATQTKLAMEFLKGEERCHTLMKIADKNPSLRQQYLEQAWTEALSYKKNSANSKKQLLLEISTRLKPLYLEEKDTISLQKLEQQLNKHTKDNPFLQNPLLKYQKKLR